ncbi:MAG: GNAT family N-acetyltransferase [Xanthomonadales bacterium]|nr:GNAT family N-acetyltransferase [Xanthomonadales bacterium]
MIKKADPLDASEISQLASVSKASWGYDDSFMATVKDELSYTAQDIAKHPTYLVKFNNEILGFYQLRSVDEITVELEALFVKPNAMGKCLGQSLFMHASAQAKKSFKTMLIESDPFAETFYLKQGCIRVGEKPSLNIPGRSLPLLHFLL